MRTSRPDPKVAEKHGITVKELNDIYYDMFAFIKEKIVALDLLNVSEEEFNKTKASFSIPNIGKLGTNYKRVKHFQEKLKKYGRNKVKENQADVHVDSDNR